MFNANLHKIEQIVITALFGFLSTHAGTSGIALSLATLGVGLLLAHSNSARWAIVQDAIDHGVPQAAKDVKV